MKKIGIIFGIVATNKSKKEEKMKKLSIVCALLLAGIGSVKAQETKPTEITAKNSWLKLGVTAGIPVGSTSNTQNLALGIDARGQLMQTNHFGFGLASGYTHYFAKENQTATDVIPAGVMFRYYPKTEGIFIGTDAGYNFVTNSGKKGGVYINPQIGYHNRDWNIYAYYNHTFNKLMPLQNVGVGATYNIRFTK